MLTGTVNTPENVTFSPGRIFINPSSFGCGSGCAYCYTKGFRDDQLVLQDDEIAYSLAYVLDHSEFKPGKNGTIISLSPDTDPFKTPDSTRLTCMILETFLPLGNPIQISTKEIVPTKALELIQRNRQYRAQVVVFVSIATITKSKSIEPFAATVEDRLENFKLLHRYDIVSCLYMKPMIQSTIKDQDLFLEAAKNYRPDTICMGAIYTKTNNSGSFTHPAHQDDNKLTSSGITNEISSLRETFIKELDTPVFYTSVCVSTYWRDCEPNPNIWLEYAHLCINCRNCGENDNTIKKNGASHEKFN